MPTLWIVDPDRLLRTRLEHLAAGAARVVSGAPGDAAFDPSRAAAAPRPDAVILGTSNLDAALQFAHDHAERLPDARWLVVHPATLPGARVHALFVGLEVLNLPWPSPPGPAARAVAELLAPRAEALPARRRREALEARALRRYQDLDLPILAPGAAPAPADRVLVRGEPGTGRLELLALLHARSRRGDEAALLPVPCDESTGVEDVARAIRPFSAHHDVTVCLLEVDRLSEAAQRALRAWIEVGAGPVPGGGPSLRWCATAGPQAGPWPGLLPELETCLGHVLVALPPLRDRTDLIEPFAVLTVAERCAERGIDPPVLSPEALGALAGHPWLGNLDELESTLDRALANRRQGGGVLEPEDLGLGHAAAGGLPSDRLTDPLADRLAEADSAPADLRDVLDLPDAEDALEALGVTPLPQPGPEPDVETEPEEPPRDPLTLIRLEPQPGGDEAPPRPAERPAPPYAAETPPPLRAAANGAGPAPANGGPPPPANGAPPARANGGPPAGVATGPATPASPPAPATPADDEEETSLLTRLAGSMAHEVRNPLVALRTFASLLPERFEDPEFRDDFQQHVLEGVSRIDGLVERLQELAEVGRPKLTPVDATGLLEGLLEESRPEIQARRLLVLQELDPTRPLALADPDLLRLALSALLHRALAWVPERADLFVASKHHPVGRGGGPTVQILLRFYSPEQTSPHAHDAARGALGLDGTSLDVLFAEHLVQLQNGSLHFERGQPDETLVVLDLPAA